MADTPDDVDDGIFNYEVPNWSDAELTTIDMAEAAGNPIESALDVTPAVPDDPSQTAAPEGAEDPNAAPDPDAKPADQAELKRDDAMSVTLDDGTDVTLADLEGAYKSMNAPDGALAVERQSALESKRVYEEGASRISAIHEELISYLSSLVPAEPNVSLITADPAQYQYQKALRDRALGELQGVMSKVDAARNTAPDLSAVQAQEEAKLVAYMPELAAPPKMAEFKTNFMASAAQLGFTRAEIESTADARIFRAIHYASLGMKANTAKKAGVATAPAQVRGTRRAPVNRGANNASALKRLGRSGSLSDAMGVNFDY